MSHYENSLPTEACSRLALARRLVVALEEGEDETAEQQLQALGTDPQPYQQAGKVAHEIHDGPYELVSGSELVKLAYNATFHARQQLENVIELTNDAAHRTLAAVELAIPHTEAIMKGANQAGIGGGTEWAMNSHRHAEAIRGELRQVITAQEYQDITGQIIKRVIASVASIEARLTELLRQAGVSTEGDSQHTNTDNGGGENENVKSVSNQAKITDQDEVDDLLRSFGL